MKCLMDRDEWYPVYDVFESDSPYAVEIPDETVRRYQEAKEALAAAIREMDVFDGKIATAYQTWRESQPGYRPPYRGPLPELPSPYSYFPAGSVGSLEGLVFVDPRDVLDENGEIIPGALERLNQ